MYTSALVAPTATTACPAVTAPDLMARDAAGTVWAHANPAELYRWISRRNDLLSTIAVASGRDPISWAGLRAN